MAVEYLRYHSRLAELLSAKKQESYATTISCVRAKVSFAILRSALLCSLCTDVPPPSGKIRRGNVCESPVYICIHYFFVLSLTVEKANVGRKIALASVHRLAEHLHAMSTQKSRYKISDYSLAMSSVPPKIPLMFLLFESWTVGSCRFQIHLCVHSCMRNEPWIHTRFSYEISTSSVSLNLM